MSKRADTAAMLSKMVDLEEIIIDTVHEMLGKTSAEVTEAMNKSEFRHKLYNNKSDFYLNDPNILVADFLRECCDRFGWRLH